jgi:hypothetical protein
MQAIQHKQEKLEVHSRLYSEDLKRRTIWETYVQSDDIKIELKKTQGLQMLSGFNQFMIGASCRLLENLSTS